jgi:hypothetical protein
LKRLKTSLTGKYIKQMRIPVITGLVNNNIAGFEGQRRCWISLHSTRFWRLVAGRAKKGKPRRNSEFGTIVAVCSCTYTVCFYGVCTYNVYKHTAPTFSDRYQSSTIDLLFCSTGSQVGWSFSTVMNYEVVLANSTIVYANKTSNPDLFWALRGGGNNFGIVTRFDMQTIPARNIYGGTTFYAPASCNTLLDAVTAYTLPRGGSYDKKTAILPNINLDPVTNSLLRSLVAFYDYDDEESASILPAALANFTAIPADVNDNSVGVSFANYTNETNTPAYASRASR